ncbi:uncharacterized protein LOC108481857 [Gossypium arboreum]|uniref:uncharacterized protein LOC108481857 n=1 Tax=Gossypium arboreum TaxID=29729 RepID=UPI0008194918|nr:uncharacterized protein LOC108481857 [Gossypium arboreum]
MEKKMNLGPDLAHVIEDMVGDKVFLKVLPKKKVLRFGQKGKLSSRFISPYEVIEQIGLVSYHLLLLPELERIHDVLPSHVVCVKEIEVQSDLSYEEELVAILDREVKVLCSKTVPLLKVLWRNHKIEEASWGSEDILRHQYP